MRRPDPARSTALLIGTATHDQQALEDLPAVRANVTELARLITTGPVDLVALERCTQLLDLPHPREAGVTIAERCGEADDLLLVYYAGHGLLDDNGELFLALPGTDPRPDWLKYTAIPFSWIRDAMRESPARTRVLILDCCFAGRALNTMSPVDVENGLADRSEIQGTFTLTATSDNVAAIAPIGAEHTAFTGELLRLLQHGPPVRDGHPDGEALTLSAVYRHLVVTLPSHGLPRPRQRNTDLAADLVLRPAPPVVAAGPTPLDDQPAEPDATAVTPANLPALVEPRPVIDTLRRPQRLLHPWHRTLLAAQWRRFALYFVSFVLFTAYLVAWIVSLQRAPEVRTPWGAVNLLAVLLECGAAGVATVLAATGIRDTSAGFWRDARIKWQFAIVVWGVVVVVLACSVFMRSWASRAGEAAQVLALIFIVAVVGLILWSMRYRYGRPTRQDSERSPARQLWWSTPAAIAFTLGTLIAALTEPDETQGQTRVGLLLKTHTLGASWMVVVSLLVGVLVAVRLYDLVTGHLALSRRTLTVTLARQGIGIRTSARNRFIAWHHLDRIFVAGNVLAIAFKRDYPEVDKPREFSYSAELGGFPVADIRHFPHTRAEILHSLAHFAGPTLHGVTPPGPEDDRLPTRTDGSPAGWYRERWST
ncbi:caspase family protein [Micromonospora sp. CPCC 205539]|uniref:caspase family protein n=1 Tax=Micromonospora sp. CPCC 205539 TaxID=3122408 RepID=UPI002FF2A7DF